MNDQLKESIIDKVQIEYSKWVGDNAERMNPEEIADWFFEKFEKVIDELIKKL